MRILKPAFCVFALLGLAISHNIMREHGGALRVVEGSMGGARFELRLPKQSLGTRSEVRHGA